MKKRVLDIIIKCLVVTFCFICFSLSNNVEAYTKQDIINYASSQSVGDVATLSLFKSYFNTFSRLINQKDLTESECNKVMNNLKTAVGILNANNVSKLSDLNKLNKFSKNAVYASLMSGASTISNAKTLNWDNTNNTENINKGETNVDIDKIKNNASKNNSTTITINKEDDTIDVFENGILMDKINIKNPKLNYVGTSSELIIVFIVSISAIVITTILILLLYKKHTARLRFVKNFIVSINIISIVLLTSSLLFKDEIEFGLGTIKLLETDRKTVTTDVVLDKENNIVKYPSYGSTYGTLKIDSLKIETKITYGDSQSLLIDSVGTSTMSGIPGDKKNIVLSGHNKQTLLKNIKDIKIGEKINIVTSYAKLTYVVTGKSIVKDEDYDKVFLDSKNETLTLYTCYPFDNNLYTNLRFVIYSDLKSIEWK